MLCLLSLVPPSPSTINDEEPPRNRGLFHWRRNAKRQTWRLQASRRPVVWSQKERHEKEEKVTAPLLQVPEKRWECVNCDATHLTREARPHTPFHPCRGLKGLTAPYVLHGTKAKVEAREREDYVRKETVQKDSEGRPIMSVVTTREDGEDCAVLAPTATIQRG